MTDLERTHLARKERFQRQARIAAEGQFAEMLAAGKCGEHNRSRFVHQLTEANIFDMMVRENGASRLLGGVQHDGYPA